MLYILTKITPAYYYVRAYYIHNNLVTEITNINTHDVNKPMKICRGGISAVHGAHYLIIRELNKYYIPETFSPREVSELADKTDGYSYIDVHNN